jgi:hypothetical protein
MLLIAEDFLTGKNSCHRSPNIGLNLKREKAASILESQALSDLSLAP